jgi:polysaccharide export outer membrane protein
LPSAAQPTAQTSGHSFGVPEPDYRIGSLDVIEVTVFQVKDLDRTVTVSGSGTITLQLIGDVKAAGKTVKELELDIASRLGAKYIRSPDVHVTVKEFGSQKITIEGSVNSPGVFSLSGRTTLLQGIAMAHGTTRIADNNVLLVRTTDGNKTMQKYDVSAIREGKADNPTLEAGDIIVVGDSLVRSVLADFLQAVVPAASLVRPY